MRQIQSVWSGDELIRQAIANVSDDEKWEVQTQTPQSVVLRRAKSIPAWQWIVFATLVVFTFGLAIILFPLLFINFKNQQIVVNTRPSGDNTIATITYTGGAKGRVNTLVQSIPGA